MRTQTITVRQCACDFLSVFSDKLQVEKESKPVVATNVAIKSKRHCVWPHYF